ncbi:MAG: glycoside hydrolase family 2 TIM barrel-domain containing protein [Bacteroidota bacterium]
MFVSSHRSFARHLMGLLGLAMLFTLGACATDSDTSTTDTSPMDEGPIPVELREENGQYQLYRGGQPFEIKGAGLEFGDMEALAAHGANTFRTWRTDNGRDTGMEVLDRAHALGLTVVMGLEVARERPGQGRGYFGFDYDDEAAVAEQLERIRAEVMRYKDHPALLMWGIGNELNLEATNPKVWDAVNGISEMIREIDPNHPTTTMLAGIGPELAEQVMTRAPDLDLISIQMYADIVNLPRYLDEIGYEGAYMVTEWGATGHWETATTEWGAPIENDSSVKADFYLQRYETAIASDPERCIGSFVFLWGQKQERTPTWYGMFLPTGEETEPVDVMHYIWNDSWPDNRVPRVEQTMLDGRGALDNIYLEAGQTVPASVTITDPDGDDVRFAWEVRRESTDLGHGGDDESVPEAIAGTIDTPDAASIQLTAPAEAGAYRLFVYAYDGQDHGAHANIPFYVNE